VRPPTLVGVIERRLLVTFRVEPGAVAALVPAPLRPQVVKGFAVAGICLLRLGGLRPRGAPAWAGRRSENAAHRIAVEWDVPGGVEHGVYIPRRDSSSLLNVAAGGRLFPGRHGRARFDVTETADRLSVGFRTADGSGGASVEARVSSRLEGSHLFADLGEASRFFEQGALGYSASRRPDRLDGVRLHTDAWRVEPLELDEVRSSFFDDRATFGAGAAELDCGLVMRAVPVVWTVVPPMSVEARSAGPVLAGTLRD